MADRIMFQQAVELYDAIGSVKLDEGLQTIRNAFRLAGRISFWDILATYIVLYRFPLLFAGKVPSLRERARNWLRPYVGTAVNLRDGYAIWRRKGSTGCGSPKSTKLPLVLFLSFNEGFFKDTLGPVVNALSRDGKFVSEVLRIPPGCEGSIWNHWSGVLESRRRATMRTLRRLRKTLLSRNQLQHLASCAPRDLRQNAYRFLRRELSWLLRREVPRLIPQLILAEHIIESHTPALVVTADDADQRCRLYESVARLAGVKSLVVQQGATTSDYPEWRYFLGDHIASMGEKSKDIMVGQGIKRSKITITGSPTFDRLTEPDLDSCARLKLSLGIKTGEKIILFASQPYYFGAFRSSKARRETIRAIIKTLGHIPDVRVVIKPHPNERESELRHLSKGLPPVILAGAGSDIALMIKACDVFVSMFSTTIYLALSIDKPTICVSLPFSGSPTLFAEAGATWVARSKDELSVLARDLISGNSVDSPPEMTEKRRTFLADWAYITDGRSSFRILELVHHMVALGAS
jgi:hypothetical protein